MATVHPAAVTANRTTLATLVATNFFGINAPAIAATEFQYVEMWAQDVAAMLGYHLGATSVAATLTPFSAPPLSLAGLTGWVSQVGAKVVAEASSLGALATKALSSVGPALMTEVAAVVANPAAALSALQSAVSAVRCT